MTEWAKVTEPLPDTSYQTPSAVTDIFIPSPFGIVTQMLIGLSWQIYRIFLDFDATPDIEFVSSNISTLTGAPPTLSPFPRPYPAIGHCQGDLVVVKRPSQGKAAQSCGIIFTARPTQVAARQFFRLRMAEGDPHDLQPALATEPATLSSWWKFPEVNIPENGIDQNGNWIFTNDLAIVTPGQGILMNCRGSGTLARLRLDDDGAILVEQP